MTIPPMKPSAAERAIARYRYLEKYRGQLVGHETRKAIQKDIEDAYLDGFRAAIEMLRRMDVALEPARRAEAELADCEAADCSECDQSFATSCLVRAGASLKAAADALEREIGDAK